MLLLGLSTHHAYSQNKLFVDKNGVLRWTKDKTEADFFGVNYTVPFAYGYRSHKALNVDMEKAIEADVYHMSRLGLDAFRVHMWDVEITDSLGNLLENEHLRLFDYLLYQLKKRNIRILLTPIAFWGNGYPEPDEKTTGFSTVYGKQHAVVLEAAIKAQENYLHQVIRHVNPYTKLSYRDDPDISAAEVNNEPKHSGPKEKTTAYINRLVAALRSTGWTKPVFYNISESPTYADAVVQSNAKGYTFQWYPTGLVAGHEQKGNLLPNIDQYLIPFSDTIAAFKKGAKVVYEFDAADVMQPLMYPVMARSFRSAGFQWATQFAYDPMATAFANTEYQTHYLNLAYTPSKAISLLIASKAFHRLPLYKKYGDFPEDTLFDVFKVSYSNQNSEMNSPEEFYYSNSSISAPKDISRLQHVAGVGNSLVVQYSGEGAYFLDKNEDGNWRLEVMPDPIAVKDPFQKASLKKEVTKIFWHTQTMHLDLPDLGTTFFIRGMNEGNTFAFDVNGQFSIHPGVYELSRSSHSPVFGSDTTYNTFFAPIPRSNELIVTHTPFEEVTGLHPFPITVQIAGSDSIEKVLVEIRPSSGRWTTLPLQKINTYTYTVLVPADAVLPGVLNYRIIIQEKNGLYQLFPGGWKEDPFAWDHITHESWHTFVASDNTPLSVFNPDVDRDHLIIFNPDVRNNSLQWISGDRPQQMVMKATVKHNSPDQFLGFHFFFGVHLTARTDELIEFKTLVLRAKADRITNIHVGFILKDGSVFSTDVLLDTVYREIEIPWNQFHVDSLLLLPRPYPSFQPLWFRSSNQKNSDIKGVEKLQVYFGTGRPETIQPLSIYLGAFWMKK